MGVTVRFITRSSYAVRDLGALGAFDVGFAELPIDVNVAGIEIFEVPCCCIMRSDHPLAGTTKVGPVDLDAMPFVTLFPEHITHVGAAEASFQSNAHWNVVAEAEFRLGLFVHEDTSEGIDIERVKALYMGNEA